MLATLLCPRLQNFNKQSQHQLLLLNSSSSSDWTAAYFKVLSRNSYIFLNTWESSHDPRIRHGENWANTLFTISVSSWMVLILSGLPNQIIVCKVLLLTYRLAYTLFVHSTFLVLLEDVPLSIIYTSFFKEWVYFHLLTFICLKLGTWISTLCFCLS